MSDNLVSRIAEETARLENANAWSAILDRLRVAGVPAREAYAMRKAVWATRWKAAQRGGGRSAQGVG